MTLGETDFLLFFLLPASTLMYDVGVRVFVRSDDDDMGIYTPLPRRRRNNVHLLDVIKIHLRLRRRWQGVAEAVVLRALCRVG